MVRTVIVGGGVVGLCTAILLGRDGHEVTVLERDRAVPPIPEQAWADWERRGVNQFRMLHTFLPRFNMVMGSQAPEIIAALEAAGALRSNVIAGLPAEISGGFGPEDAKFDAVTARRPVAEAAIAAVADATDGVTVRRGEVVIGFLTDEPTADGVPHVIGVRTESGEDFAADLVIDCGGRRTNLPSLLEAIGGQPPIEERDDSGFIYFGRHFRSADGSTPPMLGPLLMAHGSISILTLPADNGTWGVGLVTSAHDSALRKLSEVETWERVLRGYPLAAHWLDGDPLDDGVAIMAKIEDRHRTFVVDDKPVATGVIALGDAWACTNPSVGRGMSIGAIHALGLRDMLRDAPDDALGLVRAWHEVTMALAEPWYRATLAFDHARLDEMRHAIDGRAFEPGMEYAMTLALTAATTKDPDVLRGFLEIAGVLTLPNMVMSRPGMFERVLELGSGWRDEPLPGLDREQLLATIGG